MMKGKTNIQPPHMRFWQRMLVYAGTLVASSLSILNVNFEFVSLGVSCVIYFLASILLALAVICAIQDVKSIKLKVDKVIESNKFTLNLKDDTHYRAIVFSIPGTVFIGAYAVMNACVAVARFSLWCLSLSLYYALLCAMRVLIILHAKQEMHQAQNEIKKFEIARTCGVMLSASTIALGLSVTLIVTEGDSSFYPSFLIYAAATYTFYNVGSSIINIIKARKKENAYVITLRWIGHADALVSLLQLQTALFFEFGKADEILVPVANAATGLVVCVSVLALGVQMVVKSQAKINASKGGLQR